MKKHILLLSSLMVLSSTLLAQPTSDLKRDYNWLLGYNTILGYMSMNFEGDSLKTSLTQYNVPFWRNSAVMSDSAGQLIFYTNGVFLMDSTHQKMMGSDTVLTNMYDYTYSYSGQPFVQMSLALPIPHQNNKYVLLSERFNWYMVVPRDYPNDTLLGYRTTKIFYNLIDMNLNDGKGEVTSKNQTLIQDSLQLGKITACRHANGEDWWIIKSTDNSNRMHLWLLDSMGFHHQPVQQVDLALQNGTGQAFFSPDGTKYAILIASIGYDPQELDIFDFDRCSGQLSNQRRILLPADSSWSSGFAFAPNSRYMYAATGQYLYQYDSDASDISNSRQLIAEYDGFIDPDFVQGYTRFHCMHLAPDGKIYMSTTNSTRFLHVINSPDSAGLACDFRQHSIHLPSFNNGTTPNFPNFRLGALAGATDCVDATTGTDIPTPTISSIRIYPNPTDGDLLIDGECSTATLYNLTGQQLLNTNSKQISLAELSQGMYILLCYDAEGRVIHREKVVKQ